MNLDELIRQADEMVESGNYDMELAGQAVEINKLGKKLVHRAAEALLIDVSKKVERLRDSGKVNDKEAKIQFESLMSFGITTMAAGLKATNTVNEVLKGASIKDSERVFDYLTESRYVEFLHLALEEMKKKDSQQEDN